MRTVGKVLSVFSAGVGRVATGAGWLAGIMVFVIAFIVGWEVVVRGFFNRPTIWVMEVAQAMLVAVGFLAGTYALLENRHIRVTLLFGRLSPRTQRVLDTVLSLLIMPFCLILIWKGGILAYEAYRAGYSHFGLIGVPMWTTKMWLPVGGVLLVGILIVKVRQNILSLREGGGEPLAGPGRE